MEKMEKKFAGKKLLLLGTSVASVSMVKYAQRQGAYVIVTDNLEPAQSAAKQVADAVADISTRDIDALCTYVKDNQIDGVFAGVSEGNLLATMQVCEKCGLPCYFTNEQWALCQDKKSFKELCRKHGVPTPRAYEINTECGCEGIQNYPVIVKPVDASGAIGITICHNNKELFAASKVAKQASNTGRIIVEDYIVGTEITAVYTICNGKISLSLLRDRYPSLDHQGVTAQFDASIAPSRFYETYIAKVDPAVKKLLREVGLTVGTVFFQGIANEKGIFIFECGLRINALCDYYNINSLTGLNYMELLIDYALGSKCQDFKLEHEQPNPDQFCCIFNMTAHGGKIGHLAGSEECKKLPYVINAEFLLGEGRVIVDDNSMTQSIFRAYVNAPSINALQETICKMQELVRVEDVNGNNMLFKPFDVNRIIDTVYMKNRVSDSM